MPRKNSVPRRMTRREFIAARKAETAKKRQAITEVFMSLLDGDLA